MELLPPLSQPEQSPQAIFGDLHQRLIDQEPKPIVAFDPVDAVEQRAAFLDGTVRNPVHTYDRLDGLDLDASAQEIANVQSTLGKMSSADPYVVRQAAAYSDFATNYARKTEFLRAARTYNHARTVDERTAAKEAHTQLNAELFGQPDHVTYQSLLQDKLESIATKHLDTAAEGIFDELLDLVRTDVPEPGKTPERFKPSAETMEWAHNVTSALYGGMLEKIPKEKDSFTPQEARDVFERIVREEFGDAAADWNIDVERAKAINVKTGEKRLVIPEDRAPLSRGELEKLTVHEVGVHMLRSVMGGETDLALLANGLPDYYDSEEGLGVVMEQALTGTFREAGVDHYLTAGLAHFGDRDFRDVFEVKWRLKALENLKEGQPLTDAGIQKAKDTAYKGTMRSFRGTDALPWFKDLAYYNGSAQTWKHLESIRGDFDQFVYVLLGKADPTKKDHLHIQQETRSPQLPGDPVESDDRRWTFQA